MRKTLAAVVAALLACAPRAAPDLVLRGGRIYTLDPAQPEAEALAVRDGRLVFVGSDAALAEWLRGARPARVLQLGGRAVLPGFIDAHVHPLAAGLERRQLDLGALSTGEEIFAAVAAWAAAHPELPWILGHGWALPVFRDANPRREWLDRIVPDRPVLLEAADGHSAWANSRALELAGLTRASADPPHGRIERDDSGAPSGTLREAAIALVSVEAPAPSLDERVTALAEAVALMSRAGITGLHEASADLPALEAYAEAARRGLLPARVRISMRQPPTDEPADVVTARLVALSRSYGVAGLEVKSVKLFLDGVIESHTAAMLAPYADRPGERGMLLWEPRRLVPLAIALDRAGLDLHVHVIGDRAVRTALDVLAAVRRHNPWRARRPLLAHLQLVDPADLPRFAALEAVPVFQPLWACEDSYIRELTVPKLGPERSRWIYPLASVGRTVPLAFGSDWSVSSVVPLEGIETAVTRVDARAGPGAPPPFIPEERLSLPAAIAAYTTGSARALGWERVTGALSPGRSADLVILSHDPFAVAADALSDIEVLATFYAGRVSYARPGLLAAADLRPLSQARAIVVPNPADSR